MTFEQLVEVNKTLKTTDIHGKAYAEVNQRIKAFRMLYPDGTIETEILHLENDMCVIKATVGFYDTTVHGEEYFKTLATGIAYEVEGRSNINKTSYIENCVPLSTQILTKDGWKFYYQLKKGDEVLSLNMSTNEMEYCKVTAINVHKDRPLVNLKTSRFNVTCTPQHKWVATTQYKGIEKIATQDLTNSWQIIQAVRQNIEPSDKGRKLGWLMCDCDISYANGIPSTAYINQSKHIDEIKRLFGEGRKTKKYNDKWLDNYEWTIPAEKVREILGEFDIVDYKDLPKAMLKADLKDVAGCYEAVMLADGESRGFTSTYRELVEAVQIMCTRLGIATTFITNRMLENSTKPLYTLGIKKTQGAYFSEMEISNLPPQDVWCPTTENGTWVMKQNGFVTLTSNCETSAVGRALGMLGIGIDTSVASYEEVATAIEQQEQIKANDLTPEQIEVKIKTLVDLGKDEAKIREALEKEKDKGAALNKWLIQIQKGQKK